MIGSSNFHNHTAKEHLNGGQCPQMKLKKLFEISINDAIHTNLPLSVGKITFTQYITQHFSAAKTKHQLKYPLPENVLRLLLNRCVLRC